MKQTKQQIIEGLTADLLTEKSHNLKAESEIDTLQKERNKFQNESWEYKNKVKDLEKQCRAIRTINHVEKMAMIRSSIILLEYNGKDTCTHRMKQFHTDRAISVLSNEYQKCISAIHDQIDIEDLSF
jgi:predicted  nucleic acid-binding Zn-ribbon protein